MTTKMIGTPVALFNDRELPLRGFPEGRKRIRRRPGEMVVLHVRPPEGGIQRWAVKEEDGHWVPSFMLASTTVVKEG